jgi:hypothetical protein
VPAAFVDLGPLGIGAGDDVTDAQAVGQIGNERRDASVRFRAGNVQRFPECVSLVGDRRGLPGVLREGPNRVGVQAAPREGIAVDAQQV